MATPMTPETLTTLRVTGAMAAFFAYALCFRRSALSPPRGRTLLLVAGLGLFGVASLQLTYNVAITRLPLGVALLIQYLSPVLVVVWVRFVRHGPVHPRMWIAVILAVIGLAIVSQAWQGLTLDGVGVIMALLSSMSFATFFLLSEHGIAENDPLRVILWAFVTAAVAMNLIQPMWQAPGLGSGTSLLGRLDHLSVDAWLVLLWVVILGTVVPFFLQMLALRHLPATIVTVVATLEPVIAVGLGWAWFRETLTPVQALGAVAVLGGVLLAQSARRAAPALLPPQ